jgi:acyl-CoA dehydrogenase
VGRWAGRTPAVAQVDARLRRVERADPVTRVRVTYDEAGKEAPDVMIDQDSAFLDAVRSVAVDVAAVHADDVDRQARFPAEALAALRAADALSAFVPASLGGAGVSIPTIAQACFELGRRCAATGMIFAMHQIQAITIVRHLEGSPWFTEYLGRLHAEQRLIASVTSELGTGGDMGRSIAALTDHAEGGLEFTKQALTVSYGAYADDYFTTLRRTPASEETDQALVLHPAEETELTPTGSWDSLGMRGTCSPSFTVHARCVPEQLLPTPFSTVMSETSPVSFLLWSQVWLGLATEAFERGHAFVRAGARRNPGAPQPAAGAMSRVLSELWSFRSDVRAAQEDFIAGDADDRSSLHALASSLRFNNLKLSASERAPRICLAVLEAVGVNAYRNDSEYAVGRLLRDALSARLMVSNERIHAIDGELLTILKAV